MPLELLRQLIAIPSVNPMGQPFSGPNFLERRMTAFLVEWFRERDIEHEVRQLADGRANVIARLQGSTGGPTIMLDAHQDTVPVDGMTIDPFGAVLDGDRVSGRGACDVKGGMAAMLAAFARIAESPKAIEATVIMSCTCDEEIGQLGARDLGSSWTGEVPVYRLIPESPDFVVVAEPTDLQIVVAHKGTVRWRIRTAGRAAHSSDPSAGENAIYRMAVVVGALEDYAKTLHERVPAHELCGEATLSVGTIHGGSSVNIVPDFCEIQIDRRLLPGESAEKAMSDVDNYLHDRVGDIFQTQPRESGGFALLDEPEHVAWAQRLLIAVKRQQPGAGLVGVPYCTHAGTYAHYGAPSVVFGPGSIAQAHTKDEWLSVSELKKASDILFQFLSEASAES